MPSDRLHISINDSRISQRQESIDRNKGVITGTQMRPKPPISVITAYIADLRNGFVEVDVLEPSTEKAW